MLADDKQFQVECSDFGKVCEKFNGMTTNLSNQVELISNQVQRNILPKITHYLNSLGTLSRKVEKTEEEYSVFKGKFEQKLTEGAAEVDGKLAKMRSLDRELAQADQDAIELDAAFAEEDSVIEAEGAKFGHIESVKDQIESFEALEAQVSSEHEEMVAACESLQEQLSQDEAQFQSINQQVDMKKEQIDSLEARIEHIEDHAGDVAWVSTEIETRTAPFDELLNDEVFQRNLFTHNFFEELKSSMEMYEDDNTDLVNDLKALEAQEVERIAELQKIRLETSKKSSELAQVQLENQSSDREQAEMKEELKGLKEVAETANATSLKEILELLSANGKAQEDLNRAKADKEQSLKKLDKMLKDEKVKTLKAQAAAKLSENRRSSVSSVKSDKDATPVKREPIKVVIKQEPNTSSSQPPRSLKLVSPKDSSPMTQPILQPRRSLTPLKVSPPGPSQYRLTKENLKRRSDMLKENDFPVGLDDTIQSSNSPKRSRLEEEKAFDSDDSTSVSIFYFQARLT